MIALQSLKTTAEGQLCTFLLPRSYTLPIHLAQANQDEWMLAFEIAGKVLSSKEKYCSEEFSNTIAKDISKQHEIEIEKIRSMHKKEIERIQNELSNEVHSLEKSLTSKDSTYSKKIIELESSLDRANASYEKIRDQFLEEAERRIQQQKNADYELINHLKDELTRERDEKLELREKLETKIAVNQNSSKKGKVGEESFEAIAKEKKGWKLIYQGDKGHAADYKFKLDSINIRFEVKNYKTAVSTKELEKMRYDMREHPDTDMGVFLSLYSPITGLNGISIEWTPTHQPILYIPNFLEEDMGLVFDFIEIVAQTLKPYRALLSENLEDEEAHMYKDRIDRTLIYVQNGLARIASSVAQFAKDMKMLVEKITDMESHIKTNMAAQREELQSVISILTGKSIAIESVEEPENLPVFQEEKKRRQRQKKN